MNNDEQKRQFEELKEAIKHVTELLPPEYAKISLRLFAEDLLGTVIKIPKDLPFEETIQKIMKLILSESNRTDESTGSEKKKQIKNAKVTRAKNFYSPKDIASHALFDLLDGFDNSVFFSQSENTVKIPVSKTKKGEPISTFIKVNIEELLKSDKITISRELTPFDKTIHDAVISLLVAGNDCFYDNVLFRTIAGYSRYDDRPLPPTMKKAIHDSLIKLSLIRVRVNATEEAEKMKYTGLKQLKSAVFKNYLLPLKEVDLEFSNGEIIEGYKLLDTPPLYACAGAKNHILNCDMQHLRVPDTIEATPQAIVIRNYLLEQIEIMKKSSNKKSGIHRNNNILFDTLYNVLDVDNESKNENTIKSLKLRIRSTVEEFLKAWEESGYISGHNPILEGRKITGVAIEL